MKKFLVCLMGLVFAGCPAAHVAEEASAAPEAAPAMEIEAESIEVEAAPEAAPMEAEQQEATSEDVE